MDDSFRDQMGNSTTTYENNTSQILRDLALKKLRANRAENKQLNRQQYGTDLSIASPLYRTPSSRVNNKLISTPQTHPTDLPTDLPIGHRFLISSQRQITNNQS